MTGIARMTKSIGVYRISDFGDRISYNFQGVTPAARENTNGSKASDLGPNT
jgi:hypothetical protein